MNTSPEELQLRLAAIVENSDDAIISKNLSGIVQSWNTGAERIFGYTSAEMVGKPILAIIPPDRLDEEPAILEQLKRGERVDHFQTIRRRKDGTLLNVSVTISPIKDSTGTIIGASKIARDITDYLHLQQERDHLLLAERSARSDAERANRMKDEFISTLSHELRTPLNAILGWAQLIVRSPNDPETVKEGIAIIERNAKAQTQLIEDLLDMGRVISGKIRLDVQRLDLLPVIDAAVASVTPAIDSKEIRLSKILDPRAFVSGDPNRLQQVIWNLLSNSIKFTPRGGKVELTLARVNSHVEISVRDSGRGIKPEFLPHVFERFRQADSSITREYGGLGIGLAIVKNLVELHGGKVHAHSEGENTGATFTVELPFANEKAPPENRDHPTANHHAPTPIHHISLDGVKVLVVDDEEDTRNLICRLLAECKAHVFSAASADQALDLISTTPFDILISDIGMPHKDGYELIREVRRLQAAANHRFPAIALTAFARAEDRTRAMIASFQAHIAKPIDAQELIASIASLLGRTG